jgi:hypothetical protein
MKQSGGKCMCLQTALEVAEGDVSAPILPSCDKGNKGRFATFEIWWKDIVAGIEFFSDLFRDHATRIVQKTWHKPQYSKKLGIRAHQAKQRALGKIGATT